MKLAVNIFIALNLSFGLLADHAHGSSTAETNQIPSDLLAFLRSGKIDMSKSVGDIESQLLSSIHGNDFGEVWRLYLDGRDTSLKLKWWISKDSSLRIFIAALFVLGKPHEDVSAWEGWAARLDANAAEMRKNELSLVRQHKSELKKLIGSLKMPGSVSDEMKERGAAFSKP